MLFTNEQKIYFEEIIKILNDSKAIEDVILVGSWAEYLYEEENVLNGFISIAKTTDIDFLINDDKKRSNPISIIKPAQDKGFIYTEDYITGVSKLKKKEFEVEFLIAQNGDGRRPIAKTNIGINAQQLTHIGFVKNNYLSVKHNGYVINIPKPEAYVLQKMIINDRRKLKAEPDRNKIKNLLPHLNKNTFNNIYSQLYPKEKNKVDKYIKKYCQDFEFKHDKIDIVNSYKQIQENNNKKTENETKERVIYASEIETIEKQLKEFSLSKKRPEKDHFLSQNDISNKKIKEYGDD